MRKSRDRYEVFNIHLQKKKDREPYFLGSGSRWPALTPLADPHTPLTGPKTPLAGSQNPPPGPQSPFTGPWIDKRMDGHSEFLPILQDFVPSRVRCPATLCDFKTAKKQGK